MIEHKVMMMLPFSFQHRYFFIFIFLPVLAEIFSTVLYNNRVSRHLYIFSVVIEDSSDISQVSLRFAEISGKYFLSSEGIFILINAYCTQSDPDFLGGRLSPEMTMWFFSL